MREQGTPREWLRWWSSSWLLLVLLVWWNGKCCLGKKVSGSFRLSGEHSEILLASFAVAPSGARLTVNFTTGSQMYQNEVALRLHLFRDVEWPKFNKALTCQDKIVMARMQQPVQFEFSRERESWDTKNIEAILPNSQGLVDDAGTKIDAQFKGRQIQRADAESAMRPHYWYAVIDDCSLEMGYQRDGSVPDMHYELEFVNRYLPDGETAAAQVRDDDDDDDHVENAAEQGGDKPPKKQKRRRLVKFQETHLSADEFGLSTLHLGTLALSALALLYLTWHVLYYLTWARRQGGQQQVHAAVLWVWVAAVLDAAASVLELGHLRVYDQNGIGWYAADAAAAHCEALCDAALVLLLLSIGAGWTLPSDAVRVNPQESLVQKLVSDMAKPLSGGSGGRGSTILTWMVLLFHVTLAQWGRTYNDDFESYHELEHLPGRLLMGFRVFCGLLLVVCTVQTRNKLRTGGQHLKSFYAKFMVLGLLWLLWLPLLSTNASWWFVPYYLRHPVVLGGAALGQSSSIVLFAWLVTSHSTTYHQFSHMSVGAHLSNQHKAKEAASGDMSLTEALHTSASSGSGGGGGEPRTWKLMGGKAKIRLD